MRERAAAYAVVVPGDVEMSELVFRIEIDDATIRDAAARLGQVAHPGADRPAAAVGRAGGRHTSSTGPS